MNAECLIESHLKQFQNRRQSYPIKIVGIEALSTMHKKEAYQKRDEGLVLTQTHVKKLKFAHTISL
ncbi:hypothetical protein [Picosynechococcus sp. PCC 7003]|uniref:hypothetical protein n=1 Tax=Picosynechococcus sp. PCC 7003 TaxID=374981 RepID=UPI0012ED3C86|nr:hypothetical protein [Picosynechococcus sp. PCC 7003]